VLDVNTALRVDAALEMGAVTQEVSVSATAVQVETTSTQMGEVIGTQRIMTVPLNGRSYTDLLALQPGVNPISAGDYPGIAPSGSLSAGNLSVSGQREAANRFVVNGGNVEEGESNSAAIIPNLDSIEEFRIITNDADAEYGNYSGGLVNAITKSGTNQFHGDVFEFLRNSDMDSRNFYSPARGTLHQNEFGGTIGGLIKHDRLFFFSDYQGQRRRQWPGCGSLFGRTRGKLLGAGQPDGGLNRRRRVLGWHTLAGTGIYRHQRGSLLPDNGWE
jgi:outer membrane receptor for ferrienterochelin and colicin